MTVTAKIDALTHGGAFIGRIIDENSPLLGKKIFIREVAPGETVTADIIEDKKSFCEGSLLQVLTPSSARQPPPCRYFGLCGGCDLQHLELSVQRESKRKMVEDALRLHGKVVPTKPVYLIGENLSGLGYRRRIGLHLGNGSLGFFKSYSDEVVDIESCAISTSTINSALTKVRDFTPLLSTCVGDVLIEDHSDEVFIGLRLRSGVKALPAELEKALEKKFPNLDLFEGSALVWTKRKSSESAAKLPVGHFCQINREGNAALISHVIQHVEGKEVTELYAGAGNFSIPLAEQKECTVHAVELDPALTKYGIELIKAKKLSGRVSFFNESCESYVRTHKLKDTIVLDPPRAGAKGIVDALRTSSASRIIYVSCNLPTLCRDLQALSSSGFKLEETAVLDMFAQTHHVETVSVLVRA